MPYYLRAQDSNTRALYHQLRRPPSAPLITYSVSQASSHPGQPLSTSHSTCGQDSNTSLIPSVAPVAFHHYLVNFHHLQHLPTRGSEYLDHTTCGRRKQHQHHTINCAGTSHHFFAYSYRHGSAKFSLLDLGLALALGGSLDMDMDLDPELPLDAFWALASLLLD